MLPSVHPSRSETIEIGTPLMSIWLAAVWRRSWLSRDRDNHDLRHTCATLLLAQGVPARVVMEILGHSQIAVTMNTYTHVLPELQRAAADRMDEAFAGLDDVGRSGAAVKTAVNGDSDTDPENDEGPPERP
jgi:integrase